MEWTARISREPWSAVNTRTMQSPAQRRLQPSPCTSAAATRRGARVRTGIGVTVIAHRVDRHEAELVVELQGIDDAGLGIHDGGLVLRRSGFVRVVQPRGMTQLVQDDSVEVVDIGGAAAVLFQRTAVDLPIAGGVDDDVGVDVIPETVDLLIITTRDRERIAEASAVAEHPLAPAADIDAIVLARIDGHLILLPDDGQPHGLSFEIGAAIAVLRGVGVGAREPRKGRGTGDAKAQQTFHRGVSASRARTRLRKASRVSDVGATCAAAACASPCRGSTTSRPAASFTM